MAYATSASLRARIPRRRKPLASGRRIVLKALMGLAAVAIAVVAMTAVVIGVGHFLTVTFDARPDVRSAGVFAEPTSWQAWTSRPNVGMAAQRALIASLSLPATPSPAPQPSPAPEPMLALAFAPPDPQAGPIAGPDVTGSLGQTVFKLASTDSVPVRPPANLSRPDDAPSLPMPRSRPQLAALTPPNVGIGPGPDARFRRAAIYDITAQTVYLPNGERLEAHSGLGAFMDDPRHVHRRMRGATPPNTYKLTLREALFHGVRAIRMTPESDADMFGRDGILAHSYMLGPNGQSNGCVSFKNYPKFLRAFLRGEIDRMIVVRRLDKPPTFFARRDVKSASTAF